MLRVPDHFSAFVCRVELKCVLNGHKRSGIIPAICPSFFHCRHDRILEPASLMRVIDPPGDDMAVLHLRNGISNIISCSCTPLPPIGFHLYLIIHRLTRKPTEISLPFRKLVDMQKRTDCPLFCSASAGCFASITLGMAPSGSLKNAFPAWKSRPAILPMAGQL